MKPYEAKISVHVQKTILEKLQKFANTSACAGIRNNKDVAMKMATNHYGGGYVPARPWLDAATGDDHTNEHFMYEYEKELRKTLRGKISSSSPVSVESYTTSQGTTSSEVYPGRLFGKSGYAQQGSYVMRQIAKTMARNQTDFIANGLMMPNAESTVAKKGFNKPLVETMESFKSIEGWIE